MNNFPPKRAVAYYRSATHESGAIDAQRHSAWKFATEHKIEIIHEETDMGHSGLSTWRPGIINIFRHWILSKNAPAFEYVLIHDISRWGRFPNPHTAKAYERLCELYGKRVIYHSTFSSYTDPRSYEQYPPLAE